MLKDRDIASGAPMMEQDRQLYIKNNKADHRVLRRWEMENDLFDEEVLDLYCAAEGSVFDAALYRSLVTDIVNDDVKKLTGAVKKTCGIITSIDTEIFKINLAKVIRPGTAVYKELERCIFHRQ